jgi:hypothetical protein
VTAPKHPCPACGRRVRGVADHVRDKHPKWSYDPETGIGHILPPREETMADIFVEAEIARAMGEPIEDWIEEMLP